MHLSSRVATGLFASCAQSHRHNTYTHVYKYTAHNNIPINIAQFSRATLHYIAICTQNHKHTHTHIYILQAALATWHGSNHSILTMFFFIDIHSYPYILRFCEFRCTFSLRWVRQSHFHLAKSRSLSEARPSNVCSWHNSFFSISYLGEKKTLYFWSGVRSPIIACHTFWKICLSTMHFLSCSKIEVRKIDFFLSSLSIQFKCNSFQNF